MNPPKSWWRPVLVVILMFVLLGGISTILFSSILALVTHENLTKPQLELIEILKTCLKKSDTNTKYVLVYITKNKVPLIFNKEQFKGEGYYILKINKSQIIIIYPRINGNTVNSLINRGIIKKIDKNQYILNINSIENNNSREKQLKKLSELKLRLDNKEYKGFICFRVYLEVNVHKNPTCFSRWSVRYRIKYLRYI